MTRVVHVDTERGWRGGQVQLELLLHHTAGVGGLEHHLVVPLGSPWIQRAPEGVSVHPVAMRGRWLGRSDVQLRLHDLQPDLVALHTAHAVAMVHEDWPRVVHRRVDFVPSLGALRRMASARRVLAVSEAVAEILRTRGVVRVQVVHDGVDHGVARARAPREPRLVSVGALVPHKDHATLLRAMVDVPARLDVFGEGPLRPRLERRIRRRGLQDRVRLRGHVHDVSVELATATALVHPSKEEGLGQVVLEALAMGVPVVATQAGGLPEGVGGDGMLVPPQDPDALAAALRQMLTGHVRYRRHLALVHGVRARRFGVAAMVAATCAAYGEAVG